MRRVRLRTVMAALCLGRLQHTRLAAVPFRWSTHHQGRHSWHLFGRDEGARIRIPLALPAQHEQTRWHALQVPGKSTSSPREGY